MIEQKSYIEIGAINNLSNILGKIQPKKIFLVTGKGSYSSSGAEAAVSPSIAGYDVVRFSDFSVNPKIEDIVRGIELYKEEGCDFIIAVGGGSVIDVAKSVGVLSYQEGDSIDYVTGVKKIEQKGSPVVAIPTTSGSGAEATHFSVIYIDGKKYSLADIELLPHYVIIDPNLSLSMPAGLAATTGMDALSQAMEAYWSVGSTDLSKEYSKEAIKLILSNLKSSVNNGSLLNREAIAIASHLAGKAINITKTTVPHALSYALTSRFNIPHGHAVGLTLGNTLVYNSSITDGDCNDHRGAAYVKETMGELVKIMGCLSADEACSLINKLMESINLGISLEGLGVGIENIDWIVGQINYERLGNNPRRINSDGLKNLFIHN